MRVPDEKIIAALLSCSTNKEAAAQIGLTETQLYNRMRKSEFRAKLTEAKARLLESATAAAQGRMGEAVTVMVEIMNDGDNAPQVRLNAADAILRNGMKLTEAVDVMARMDALEKMIVEAEKR